VSLLDRVNAAARPERRALETPWQPWTSPFVPFSAGGPRHPSEAHVGLEASLRLGPLYAGARLLADMVASLPLQQYRKTADGKPFKMASSSLFDKPSAYGTIYDWLHQAMVSLVLQGNAWGLITGRDGYGYPTGIEWLPPERVTVTDDEAQPWNPVRARIYVYGAQVNRENLFHVRAFSVPGKVAGLSPLRLFMELIQSGQDALGYGASWYKAGGWPPGTFQNQELEVDADQADEIRRRLTNSIKRREPLVYGRDWDYKPVSVPPSEAQFIQAMQLNATQIAAILGLPPERIGGSRGDSLTYSTQEQESISLLTDTLRPWLVRLETAFFDVLPQQQYVRFSTAGMLKTTTEQRHQIYKLDRDMGLVTTNEVRDLEEMPPMPGGIGDDPIPLEVLVAMGRGIKEIPRSFESLITQSPSDIAAAAAAQATAKIHADALKTQAPPQAPGQPSQPPDGAPPPPAAQDVPAPAAAAARWPGDYQLDEKRLNGAHRG
jgi:HK97 family phage portal protein